MKQLCSILGRVIAAVALFGSALIVNVSAAVDTVHAHDSVTREINCAPGAGPWSQPQLRPRTITYACATLEGNVSHITWVSWTNTHAVGLGILTSDLCDPACVDGPTASWPAVIVLENPVKDGADGLLFMHAAVAQLQINPSSLTWAINETGAPTPSTFPISEVMPKRSPKVAMIALYIPK